MLLAISAQRLCANRAKRAACLTFSSCWGEGGGGTKQSQRPGGIPHPGAVVCGREGG